LVTTPAATGEDHGGGGGARPPRPATPLSPDAYVVYGSSAADDDEGEGDDDDAHELEQQRTRRRVIELALEEQDRNFREERRRKVWGDFANATSREEVARVEQSLRKRIADENDRKAEIAQGQGVQMEILEPSEDYLNDLAYQEDGDVHIKFGSGQGKEWYHEMDEDLKQEWEALEGGDVDPNGYSDEDRFDTVEVNGKYVVRDTLKGVRVGSAGGWTLEVFPGDFVVHRKYGIGRFEKTCLRPRSVLTEEEIEAQQVRRRELLAEATREIPGGGTPIQIEEIRSKFGTEEDTDPISNPQSTVLEVAYADGVVHVPVDRAYRLSRYRAGNSILKPKLSRVRGDQWRNARRKVEETTLELAQDVLALYATRETLQRQPFDPAKENEVKEVERTFPFEPTKDQAKCFEDVENDMVWRSRPMDRLVCGDVG
jgi:CarD-like/TRCF domain